MEENYNDENQYIDADEHLQPKGLTERLNLHLRNNYKLWIYIVIAIILLIVIIYFAFNYIKKNKEKDIEEAGTAITRLMSAYNQNDPQSIQLALYGNKAIVIRNKPLIGFIEIANKYDNVPQGKLAAFYAGNLLMSEKKFQEAEKYFKKALKADSKLVLQGAYAGLGSIEEQKGNFDKAINHYKDAVANYTDFGAKNRYEYYMGLCFEKLGKKDEAINIYNNIINENKSSEFVGRSKMGLIRLGTIIE